MACSYLGRLTGRRHLISLDMGGTTAKAAIVEDGEPVRDERVRGRRRHQPLEQARQGRRPPDQASLHRRLRDRGGRRQRRRDRRARQRHRRAGQRRRRSGAGVLRAGRRDPTLTDALLALGYLNAGRLGGGAITLDPRRSREALDRVVATPLGRSVEAASYGILMLAVATMTRAVKAVTTYRGRDPRDFTLCAFGGNGPLTGVEIARSLAMSTVLIPLSRSLQRPRASLLRHRARGGTHVDAARR